MRAARHRIARWVTLVCALSIPALGAEPEQAEYRRRVETVRRMPGFVALWDFVKRGDDRRFAAHQASGDPHDFRLDAVNYVLDYWGTGRAASYDDFPLLGRGPFGQAVQFRNESDVSFRPCLLVPRARLQGSGLDVKGAGRSVSMVVWLIRESGNHAAAGIWHEGTDLPSSHGAVQRVERGQRQYALFAGLAANAGASAVHVSENGASSFGDRYARNLAVTPEVIPTASPDSPAEVLDAAWSVMGFSFDNRNNTVTAYLNGKATEFWIEQSLASHPFFKWTYQAWTQAELRRTPGLQLGEDPAFPKSQFYTPPEGRASRKVLIEETADRRVEVHHFAFTKVRVTLEKDDRGKFRKVVSRELVGLKVNSFWFGHDLYTPATPGEGGPFTIGRVIHTSRGVGFTGYIGGVAVFGRALGPQEMRKLAALTGKGLLPASAVQASR
jgi:hypothetical protein